MKMWRSIIGAPLFHNHNVAKDALNGVIVPKEAQYFWGFRAR